MSQSSSNETEDISSPNIIENQEEDGNDHQLLVKTFTPEEVNQPPKYPISIKDKVVGVQRWPPTWRKNRLCHLSFVDSNNLVLKHFHLGLGALAVILSVVFLRAWYVQKQETHVRQSCEHFLPLASKYPNTDDMLWATLKVGVDRAVNEPGEPATFIFLYNSDSIGQFLSLMDDVIRTTNKCFGNGGGAIWRTSDDFKSLLMTQDDRAVLERHREELQSQGVLVVRDLDRVPPNAAQVFFTICDSYEPLVRKAAIFFTIDISQQAANQSQQQIPTSIAEGILEDLWRKELHSNVLDALLVRLTENVFKID